MKIKLLKGPNIREDIIITTKWIKIPEVFIYDNGFKTLFYIFEVMNEGCYCYKEITYRGYYHAPTGLGDLWANGAHRAYSAQEFDRFVGHITPCVEGASKDYTEST